MFARVVGSVLVAIDQKASFGKTLPNRSPLAFFEVEPTTRSHLLPPVAFSPRTRWIHGVDGASSWFLSRQSMRSFLGCLGSVFFSLAHANVPSSVLFWVFPFNLSLSNPSHPGLFPVHSGPQVGSKGSSSRRPGTKRSVSRTCVVAAQANGTHRDGSVDASVGWEDA